MSFSWISNILVTNKFITKSLDFFRCAKLFVNLFVLFLFDTGFSRPIIRYPYIFLFFAPFVTNQGIIGFARFQTGTRRHHFLNPSLFLSLLQGLKAQGEAVIRHLQTAFLRFRAAFSASAMHKQAFTRKDG